MITTMFLVWVLVSSLNDSSSEPVPALPAAPVATEVPYQGDCLPGTEVRTLCQNCARLTRTHKAFRMCCFDDPGNSTESVRDYCRRLLAHTVGSSDNRPQRVVGRTRRPVR